MTTPSTPTDTWRIVRMTGGAGTTSHPLMVKTPGCPDERHPTRWCQCKPFRTQEQAEAYIAEQTEEHRA